MSKVRVDIKKKLIDLGVEEADEMSSMVYWVHRTLVEKKFIFDTHISKGSVDFVFSRKFDIYTISVKSNMRITLNSKEVSLEEMERAL